MSGYENKRLVEIKYDGAYLSNFMLAEMEVENGNLELAAKYIERNLERNLSDPRAWLKLGNLYGRTGLDVKENAYACYQQALNFDSTYSTAYLCYAIAASEYGDSEIAVEMVLKGVRYEESIYSYYCAGYVLVGLGDYKNGLEYLNAAYALFQKGSMCSVELLEKVLYETSFASYKLGDFQSALYYINTAIQFNPYYAVGYILKGDIYSRNGDNFQACESWKIAQQLYIEYDIPNASHYLSSLNGRVSKYCR